MKHIKGAFSFEFYFHPLVTAYSFLTSQESLCIPTSHCGSRINYHALIRGEIDHVIYHTDFRSFGLDFNLA